MDTRPVVAFNHDGASMTGCRAVFITLCALVVALCWAPAALADGGNTIASAPYVAYGQQEFGNAVVNGDPNIGCYDPHGQGNSWWNLPVMAGDHVTVNLEGQTANDDGFDGKVYAPGTNDYSVADADVYQWASPGGSNYDQLTFQAPRDGVMPLDINSCDSSATYDFIAYDLHRLVTNIGWQGVPSQHRTNVWVVASNADGQRVNTLLACTVQQRYGGAWHNLGTVSAASGVCGWYFTWHASSRGHAFPFRAIVWGSGYQTTATRVANILAVAGDPGPEHRAPDSEGVPAGLVAKAVHLSPRL